MCRPVWVIAMLAPAGSHLPMLGTSGARIEPSITKVHPMAPMIAMIMLRVIAPRATPSVPNNAVTTVAPAHICAVSPAR